MEGCERRTEHLNWTYRLQSNRSVRNWLRWNGIDHICLMLLSVLFWFFFLFGREFKSAHTKFMWLVDTFCFLFRLVFVWSIGCERHRVFESICIGLVLGCAWMSKCSLYESMCYRMRRCEICDTTKATQPTWISKFIYSIFKCAVELQLNVICVCRFFFSFFFPFFFFRCWFIHSFCRYFIYPLMCRRRRRQICVWHVWCVPSNMTYSLYGLLRAP